MREKWDARLRYGGIAESCEGRSSHCCCREGLSVACLLLSCLDAVVRILVKNTDLTCVHLTIAIGLRPTISFYSGLPPSVIQFANIAVSVVSSRVLRVRVLARPPLRHGSVFQETAIALVLTCERVTSPSAHDRRHRELP